MGTTITGPTIRGVPVEMGGRDWIVPPLTLGQVRALKPERDAVNREDASDDEIQRASAAIILAALQRNYPDLTLETLESELLDLGNFRPVLIATLTGSGLRPAVSPKDGLGEAAAARIGEASMGSSPQPAATSPATSMS